MWLVTNQSRRVEEGGGINLGSVAKPGSSQFKSYFFTFLSSYFDNLLSVGYFQVRDFELFDG